MKNLEWYEVLGCAMGVIGATLFGGATGIGTVIISFILGCLLLFVFKNCY